MKKATDVNSKLTAGRPRVRVSIAGPFSRPVDERSPSPRRETARFDTRRDKSFTERRRLSNPRPSLAPRRCRHAGHAYGAGKPNLGN